MSPKGVRLEKGVSKYPRKEIYEYVKDEMSKGRKAAEVWEEAAQLFDVSTAGMVENIYYQEKKLDPNPFTAHGGKGGPNGGNGEQIYREVEALLNDGMHTGVSQCFSIVAQVHGMTEKAVGGAYYYHKKKVEAEQVNDRKKKLDNINPDRDCPDCGTGLKFDPNRGVKYCMNENCLYEKAIPGYVLPEKPIPQAKAEVAATASSNWKPYAPSSPSSPAPVPANKVTVMPPTNPNDLIKMMSKLAGLSQQTGIDLGAVFGGLMPLFELATEAGNARAMGVNMEKVLSESEQYKHRAEKAEAKAQELENKLTSLQEYTGKLENITSTYFNKDSFRKLADLEDFTSDLKVFFDQYGNYQGRASNKTN